ncbi:glycosyltransferase [Solibacillus sp. MA9]|uniref:Glycosyltransferase n=1 Tax=Solibacillus palustris TaxID=2908203 RepID=A0ABS9UAI1_9BACL|nr:glycosyltransferase [Solibacillus sp. MA9]MCH7321025.1 glycosyltransferase [Solibacillus sp. MA9]
MKRILVVVDNLNSGGIASVVLNISESADTENYIFDYIVYKQPNKEIVQRIEKIKGKYFVVNRLSETTPFKYVKNIREIIRTNGPYDAIHAHTSSFIWLSCLAAKKENISIRVGHAHGSKNSKQFLLSEMFYSTLKFLNRKYCTKKIACAEISGQYIFGNEFDFIPNFIDHKKYLTVNKEEIDEFMLQHNIPRTFEIYCFIGYLGGEKNPMFALKLFKEILSDHSNSLLLIAGEGPDSNQIGEYIKENKMENKVKMFGNTDKVKEILQISHTLLMPSFSEGMSMALLEAQISGVNCIVSKGVPKTNDIKAGLFHQCPILSVSNWIDMIKEVKKRDKISQIEIVKSLQKIEYNKESVVKKYEIIYSNLNSE